jgi:hypothetical protein
MVDDEREDIELSDLFTQWKELIVASKAANIPQGRMNRACLTHVALLAIDGRKRGDEMALEKIIADLRQVEYLFAAEFLPVGNGKRP